MDKFTVDLDQVLNDFEYSELTDHFTTPKPQDTTSSLNHNNVIKHSINNVFHSLNEYLNTSIDVPDIQSNFKEIDVLKNDEDIDVETVGCSSNDEAKNILLKNCADNNFFKDSKEYVNSKENNTFVNYAKTNENLIDDSVKIEREPINFDEDLTKTQIDSEFTNEPQNILYQDKGQDESICDLSEQIKNEETHDSVHLDTTAEILSNSNYSNEDNLIIISTQAQPTSIKENDQDIIEEPFVETEISNETGVTKEIVNPVGFQEIADLDDEKILELLAEFENEEELLKRDSQANYFDGERKEDCQNDKKITDGSEIIESKEQLTVPEESGITQISLEPNVQNDNFPEKNLDLEEIVPIDNIKETEEDSAAVGKNLENLESQHIDVVYSDEATHEKDRESENITEIKNEGSTNENVEEEESYKVEEKDSKKEHEDIVNQETMCRPPDLPLTEGDIGPREINRIGNPGSTPYNNVYIAEEINKHQEQDNESISSTSSNTLSDSTASTASTEEIKDDNDVTITNASVIQQQTTESLENPESLSRELSNDESSTRNLTEVMPNLDNVTIEESTRHTGEGEISAETNERQWLGKEAPLWIPDSDAMSCLHCCVKFTVLKRRHHCRACGLVLCSTCCHIRFKLEYLDGEARICNKCHEILSKDTSSSSSGLSSPDLENSPLRRPNPNNPLEYCSTISPLQQVSGSTHTPLPAVMVPVGVLKRKGSKKTKTNKSVTFCDGIKPGSDLTNLDNDFDYNNTRSEKLEKPSNSGKTNRNLPAICSETDCFIPKSEESLPPLVTFTETDVLYTDCLNNSATVELLKNGQLSFAILLNLYVHVKIINMSCCINKMAWCFSTEGLINVGQDEIVYILEYTDEESCVPRDILYHIYNIYAEAVKGSSFKELGISLHSTPNFLGSKNHVGFVYIRPTFQCLENVVKPKEPFLIGILIHRWETPWAKLFPLRLILRLGAEYRYYPSPVISTRHRESVFVEIGHTIINLLADFRNFSYSLPQINGLVIHMKDKNTTVTIPVNRYDQVIKTLNNSSDHILAFGGSFSQEADSHLVCIQDTQGDENCYSTHAINIQNKPRKVTGASFIVFNGALKSSSGLTAKSNIIEDGLMIQVLPEHMQQIRDNLRAMKNHTISCGCVNAATYETVNIIWGENDTNFNIGVTSSIDGMSLSGIPSIRVHNGKNHHGANGNRMIRWTEVFIIQSGDENPKNQDPIDISKISESIAKATCDALLNYLDLLVSSSCQKIGIRTTLHVDSVSYCAGSNNTKLPAIYMKSLDNELVPVLHRTTSSNLGEKAIILELIFRILNI